MLVLFVAVWALFLAGLALFGGCLDGLLALFGLFFNCFGLVFSSLALFWADLGCFATVWASLGLL